MGGCRAGAAEAIARDTYDRSQPATTFTCWLTCGELLHHFLTFPEGAPWPVLT